MGRQSAENRVDWETDDWGRRIPVYRLMIDDPRNFDRPLSLLVHAARMYLQSGETEIPTEEEAMYKSNDWESQVLLAVENLKVARDIRKGN